MSSRCAAAFSTALELRGHVEAAGGYTIMTSGRQDLNEVDPVTGVVIRKAGSVDFTAPRHAAATAGTMSGAVVSASSLDNAVQFAHVPPSLPKKIGIWGLAIIAIVLIAGAISVLFASSDGQSADLMSVLQTGRIVLVGLGVLVALIVSGTAISQGAKLRTAKAVRPDAFVFMTQRTPELIDALKAIGTDRPRLRQFVAVTLGPKGIELWGRGRTDVPRIALPWNDIDYAHPGRHVVEARHISVAVLALHIIQTVDGRPLDLPFPIFGPRGMNRAGAHDANKVLNVCSRYPSIA